MSADQGVPTKPIDFNQILSMGKLAFTQIRYAYEGLPPYSGWNAGEILIATRQYLLEINPSWARSSLSYPLPVAHFGP